MVERTKRRYSEELGTGMDGTDSDAMEPDMESSGSEDLDENDVDMLNDQMEIDSHAIPQQQQQQKQQHEQQQQQQPRSPSVRSRLDSTSSGGQRKKTTPIKAQKKQRTSERRTSVRECVECDSASVDSLKLDEECSPDQILDLIDEALKNDRRSLERLIREPISHFPVLDESIANQLLELLLRNPQLSVYGHVRWLKQLLSSTGAAESTLFKKAENRKLVEPMLDRASSISAHCLRLRGKLDLLMGPTGAVS